jgi:hypothetical protein
MGGGFFDIEIFVLASPAFRRKHPPPVNFFKIAIGEFVVLLGLLIVLIIHAQMPFAVFAKTVRADEFIFFLRRRLVLAPCISVVRYEGSPAHEVLSMAVRALI